MRQERRTDALDEDREPRQSWGVCCRRVDRKNNTQAGPSADGKCRTPKWRSCINRRKYFSRSRLTIHQTKSRRPTLLNGWVGATWLQWTRSSARNVLFIWKFAVVAGDCRRNRCSRNCNYLNIKPAVNAKWFWWMANTYWRRTGRAAVPKKTGLKEIQQLPDPLPVHTWSNSDHHGYRMEQGKG